MDGFIPVKSERVFPTVSGPVEEAPHWGLSLSRGVGSAAEAPGVRTLLSDIHAHMHARTHARTHTHTHTSFCLLHFSPPYSLYFVYTFLHGANQIKRCYLFMQTNLSLSLSLLLRESGCCHTCLRVLSLGVQRCLRVVVSSLRDLCSLYRQDQEVCATVLLGLLPAIQCLGQTQHPANEMRHVQGVLLQVMSGFWWVPRFIDLGVRHTVWSRIALKQG